MNNSRPAFQLYAIGESRNGWKFRMMSKTIFTDRSVAERYIPEFEEKCCDEEQLESAVPGTLQTSITELELFDD
jgi:hypothetical protein